MDEGTLNDLLECSVCLERLDTSSKVLPCQHTFCKKCLHEIVESHKELRCPECRILVPIKVDELPPNVLLMRILEGMRNAAPKKVHRNNAHNTVPNAVPMSPMQQQQMHHHHHHSTFNHRHKSNKQLTPLAPHQAYAKALYNFISKEPGDLNFKRDEIIMLRKRVDSYWYEGECGGKKGVFPINFVQIITPVPSNIPQCKALYDFRMTNDEEEGCLVFNKGDIITVIRRVDENWAEGKLDGRIGIFPLAFVELNNLARSLMKLSTNAQPGPSRVAPPTPTAEDSAPLIPTDHSRTMGSVHLAQPNTPKHAAGNPPAAGLPTSDSSSTVSSGASSTTTTPNTSSSNTSSSSSTAPSSPASPPTRAAVVNRTQKHDQGMVSTPQRQPPPAHLSPHQSREKRHSFTSLTVPQQQSSTYRHSAEILCTEGAESASPVSERHRRNLGDAIQLPAAYIALYPYKPQKADELELRKGGIYTVTEKCQDGWFKGTSNRTQKSGVFPGNYVSPASAPRSPQTQNSSDPKSAVSYTRSKGGSRNSNLPPELPPRSTSPNAISSSWHGQQDNTAAPLGRSSSAALMSTVNLTLTYSKASEKQPKERKEKSSSSSTVGMMKRLASFKRSKSPPPPSYSMDNPVFEDAAVSSTSTVQPVHVRSEPQPSSNSATSSPNVHHHRKSHSLDAGNKAKTGTQTVRERFRCIAPYPPNSEYELELQVNDIIYVHKKRDDGWYKGTQQRTGRTGLFPASFVESY